MSNRHAVLLRSEEVALYYQWFLDVEVMIFLGFGFLMTFLRRYSYSAVAFNFFVSAFVMIYGILVIGGVQQAGCACSPPRAACFAHTRHPRRSVDGLSAGRV